MLNDDDVTVTLAKLRDSFQAFTGCAEDEAEQTFAVIFAGWGMLPEQLADVLRTLVVPAIGMHTNPVLLWLYSTVQMSRTPAGRQLLAEAAKGLARIDRAKRAVSN